MVHVQVAQYRILFTAPPILKGGAILRCPQVFIPSFHKHRTNLTKILPVYNACKTHYSLLLPSASLYSLLLKGGGDSLVSSRVCSIIPPALYGLTKILSVYALKTHFSLLLDLTTLHSPFTKALPVLSTTSNLSQTASHPRWCFYPES